MPEREWAWRGMPTLRRYRRNRDGRAVASREKRKSMTKLSDKNVYTTKTFKKCTDAVAVDQSSGAVAAERR